MLQYRLLEDIDAFTEYQKNDETPEEYVVMDLRHYIVGNIDNYTATWSNGNMECAIYNAPSHDELIKMIDSIYEGN